MKTIEKKCWPKFFEKVLSGEKKFELRLNDEEIVEGDTLVLKEWDPTTKAYTGREVIKKVTYALAFKVDELFWPAKEVAQKGLRILSLE